MKTGITENFIAHDIDRIGYHIVVHPFTNDEFDFIKGCINFQYQSVMASQSLPTHVYEKINVPSFSVAQYHEVSKYVSHSSIWPKKSRCLDSSFADWFTHTSYYSLLSKHFGDIEISDEENLGYPNIYWRLVRPGTKTDIGPLHRDSWFWEMYKQLGKSLPSYKRVKTWISINIETDRNGLLVLPNSHNLNTIDWKLSEVNGLLKPCLISDIKQGDMSLLSTPSNSSVIFDDDLLHGGALNCGSSTRISMEFTFYVK